MDDCLLAKSAFHFVDVEAERTSCFVKWNFSLPSQPPNVRGRKSQNFGERIGADERFLRGGIGWAGLRTAFPSTILF